MDAVKAWVIYDWACLIGALALLAGIAAGCLCVIAHALG